jgi:putative FmdB family regulatory protein
MPTYEYICQQCGHELEAFQRMSDDPLKDCPECQTASLKRKIGLGAGIIFKGGGFYETDFKDRKGVAKADESKAGESSTAKEKKAEEKSAAKTEKKPTASDS